MKAPRRAIDGVLLLDKPLGLSSNAALQRVKKLYNAEKAGHSGTLDPLATGLLPVLFGEATKFGAFLLDSDKAYVARLHFGIRTSTGDAEGEVLSRRVADFDLGRLKEAVAAFIGPISQVPPMYSALKREGRALYEYARAGQTLERKPRAVFIHLLEIEEFAPPFAVLRIRCSKGTYIRTLAEDLGEVLGCGAHLSALRRVGAGRFGMEKTVELDTLEATAEPARDNYLLPLDALLADLPEVRLNAEETRRFCQGQALRAMENLQADRVRVLGDGGQFLGIGKIDSQGQLQPRRLLRN